MGKKEIEEQGKEDRRVEGKKKTDIPFNFCIVYSGEEKTLDFFDTIYISPIKIKYKTLRQKAVKIMSLNVFNLFDHHQSEIICIRSVFL